MRAAWHQGTAPIGDRESFHWKRCSSATTGRSQDSIGFVDYVLFANQQTQKEFLAMVAFAF